MVNGFFVDDDLISLSVNFLVDGSSVKDLFTEYDGICKKDKDFKLIGSVDYIGVVNSDREGKGQHYEAAISMGSSSKFCYLEFLFDRNNKIKIIGDKIVVE